MVLICQAVAACNLLILHFLSQLNKNIMLSKKYFLHLDILPSFLRSDSLSPIIRIHLKFRLKVLIGCPSLGHVITLVNLGADWLTAYSHVITMVNLRDDWLAAYSHVITLVNQGDDWSIALWPSDYSGDHSVCNM